MKKQNFDVNNLRVASPCSVGWETMSGDERRRFCTICQLHVYNFSEMNADEIRKLVEKSESRICGRLYKRADGTVLTKDCPVGFRAYQKRVARFAGAALATILGLFSVSFGQKADKKSLDTSQIEIASTIDQNYASSLSGKIIAPTGAVSRSVEITIYKDKKRKIKIKSGNDGFYKLPSLLAGIYTLEIESKGFETFKIVQLSVKDNEQIKLDIRLKLKDEEMIVGVISEKPLTDAASSDGTTNITF